MDFLRFQKEFCDIPGFTQPESMCIWDSCWNSSHRLGNGSLLEIGVYYGQSAMMLVLQCKNGETILLVDPS